MEALARRFQQVGTGQIYFPATQNPSTGVNVLDDYEEGTFTPGIADLSLDGSGEGQTYAVQAGNYTKIGNRVFFSLALAISSLGTLTTSQAAAITGLPFTSSSTANSDSSVSIGLGLLLAIPNAGEAVTGRVRTNSTHIELRLWDGTLGTTNMTVAEVSADGQLMASGHYQV